MTLTAANIGGWSLNEILTSAQMNHLQSELVKALDGEGGGSYVLTAPLNLDGDELQIEDTLRMQAGSALVISGTAVMTAASSSIVDFDSGSFLNISAGADMNIEAGADVIVGDLDDLAVDDDDHEYTICLSAAYVEEDGAGEATWTLTRAVAPGNWVQQSIAPGSGAQVFFGLRVDPGDTIEEIVARVDGGVSGVGVHALLPTLPELTLVETEGFTALGLAVDIATEQDTSASTAAYDDPHNITLDNTTSGGALPYVAQPDAHYWVRINGERGANAIANELAILAIRATIIRTKLVPVGIM